MKKIITSFSHSGLLTENLANYRKLDRKPILAVKTFVDIRWNSIYVSVHRFIELQPQIKAAIDENSKHKNVNHLNSFFHHSYNFMSLNRLLNLHKLII